MQDYPWTAQVAAALLEINVNNLGNRIAAAERAISDRLANGDALDFKERQNIRDAQIALQALKKEIH